MAMNHLSDQQPLFDELRSTDRETPEARAARLNRERQRRWRRRQGAYSYAHEAISDDARRLDDGQR